MSQAPHSSDKIISQESTRLARRLNFKDAVFLGLGSMIGAGIFVVAGPAAEAAGAGLLVSLVFAACIAFLNATSMAQLAAVYPESGGTYIYGRERLGPAWGFLAGWGFVIAKLASCAAMALTFASYAFPDNELVMACLALVGLTFINYNGVKKTAFVTKVLVCLVMLSLIVVVIGALAGGAVEPARLSAILNISGIEGIFEATGLIFFAFAGYARIATLGEEVIQPAQTIPRAMLTALFLTFLIYLIIFLTTLVTVDLQDLSVSKTPLLLALKSGEYSNLSPIVRIGASLASLSVLLSLMAGIARTMFAMASNRDLPHCLSAVHPLRKIPHRAELLVGLIILIVLISADLRSAIGFSSFAILIYYAIANFAAFTLPKELRLWPRWMPIVGMIVCLIIAFSLPKTSILLGMALFALGLALFLISNFLEKKRGSFFF